MFTDVGCFRRRPDILVSKQTLLKIGYGKKLRNSSVFSMEEKNVQLAKA
jgi:hypothetical protein